ncbi:hypothetical protein JCM8097_005220 [Rhodosporidiobolus ruineniae]
MSPFSCLRGDPGHDDTLPRHAHLPPLQPSPPRSPSRRGGGGGAGAHGRRSLDSAGRDRQAIKMRIGAPTGFKHVGHVGGDGAFGEEGGLATSLAAMTGAGLSSSPMRPSLSAPSSSPSSPRLAKPAHHDLRTPDFARSASASSPLSPLGNKHFSLPAAVPFGDASNRSPSLHASSPFPDGSPSPKPRPFSAQPPMKRKAAPPVTASVIRAVPGREREVEKSGPIPTLARAGGSPLSATQEGEKRAGEGAEEREGQKPKPSVLALQDLFTPSEIRAIQHYQREDGGGEVPATIREGEKREQEQEHKEPGPQTRIFNRAMEDVEAALKQAA